MSTAKTAIPPVVGTASGTSSATASRPHAPTMNGVRVPARSLHQPVTTTATSTATSVVAVSTPVSAVAASGGTPTWSVSTYSWNA
nr:hypothetical protein [Cellulomonas sp. JZ18]